MGSWNTYSETPRGAVRFQQENTWTMIEYEAISYWVIISTRSRIDAEVGLVAAATKCAMQATVGGLKIISRCALMLSSLNPWATIYLQDIKQKAKVKNGKGNEITLFLFDFSRRLTFRDSNLLKILDFSMFALVSLLRLTELRRKMFVNHVKMFVKHVKGGSFDITSKSCLCNELKNWNFHCTLPFI